MIYDYKMNSSVALTTADILKYRIFFEQCFLNCIFTFYFENFALQNEN